MREGRRADRGLSSRRHGAARPRPRQGARAQPASRLRSHDRLGPERPARRARRPRHRLHRALGRARRDRPCRRSAGAAAQSRRRLRRRRHAARVRHRLRRHRGARERPRPGRRRGDGRWRGAAGDDVRGHDRLGRLARRRARHERPRLGRAVVRHLRDARRRARRGGCDRVQVLRRAARAARARRVLAQDAARPQHLAGAAHRARRALQGADARRVGCRVRRLRCVRRAGADVRRIAPRSACGRARRNGRDRRHRTARARAALLAHGGSCRRGAAGARQRRR